MVALLLFAFAVVMPGMASAQSNPGSAPVSPPPAPTAAPAIEQPDPDLQLVPGEPDFTLGALPTTLRLPSGKFDFRLTHRFSLPINSGTTGDFFKNFFNLDSSAQTGFELRYGLLPGAQVVLHRTNERTIQLLGQLELVGQGDAGWLSMDLLAAVEGRENFSARYATTIAGVFSHRFGQEAALYAEPMVVINANARPTTGQEHHTGMLGLGCLFRLGASRTYLVGEFAPRLAGFRPGIDHISVGIEKRQGGHMFQLNVSNTVGTTLAQVARGGLPSRNWYIGFNLTRKFF